MLRFSLLKAFPARRTVTFSTIASTDDLSINETIGSDVKAKRIRVRTGEGKTVRKQKETEAIDKEISSINFSLALDKPHRYYSDLKYARVT